MGRLIIWGAGGHGKVVLGIARGTGRYADIRFVDDDLAKAGQIFCGYAVASALSTPEPYRGEELVVAIGSNRARAQRAARAESWGVPLATLIHRSAMLDESVSLGAGTVVMAGVIVNAHARAGMNCILNSGAIIEHDCHIGDHCHISPGAVLGGGVQVARYAHVGIGAVILPGLEIGEGAIVGGGAVVIDPVEPYTTVVGVPARCIRRRVADRGTDEIPPMVEALC